MTPDPVPDPDAHPLDEALGTIHQIAWQLQFRHGMTTTALELAKAHEQIQQFLLTQEK